MVLQPSHDFLPGDSVDTGPVPRLGSILVGSGALSAKALHLALVHQAEQPAPLGRILRLRGDIDDAVLADALALQFKAARVDPRALPPDLPLIDAVGARFCAVHGILPLARSGALTLVATSSPELFNLVRPFLEDRLGPVAMAVGAEAELRDILLDLRKRHLARESERRVAKRYSCRGLSSPAIVSGSLILALTLLSCLALAPGALIVGLTGLALSVLLINTAFAATMAVVHVVARRREKPALPRAPLRFVPVTVMVPLFREKQIAERLIQRLSQLDYPAGMLEILLVVEEDDHVTRDTLAACALPATMRCVTVPRGTVQTKPRALNFALDFCRGSIVGIYDAEDAPDAAQIALVVGQFQRSAPQVACLQGRLDYYNAHANWMARCFTIEYATWFRVMLPGLARLGLVLPLGGTTLFFRKSALVSLGGWDSHNVTEDADLGLRLARQGFRTELLDSTTMEEANCRPWAWVRQRSRWNKGYALTWLVHMSDPVALWRDLGARRFWGVQVLMLGGLLGTFLAPFLWATALLWFGVAHPLTGQLGPMVDTAIAWGLGLATLIHCAVWAIGTHSRGDKSLLVWVPTLVVYHMLGTAAICKAALEILWKPFFWDKTSHGHLSGPVSLPCPPVPPPP